MKFRSSVASRNLTEGGAVRLAYTKEQVKDAPGVEPDQELNDSEALWSHYGLDYETGHNGTDASGDREEPVGRDTSGPETDSAMTRSEEEVNVGTREREKGRARLRKYVVTEEVTKTVPIRKEKAVLEREPITEGNVDAAPDPEGARSAPCPLRRWRGCGSSSLPRPCPSPQCPRCPLPSVRSGSKPTF